jgi:LacI family transcriptional regulator
LLGDRERIFTAVERLRGYQDALAAHGIPYDRALVRMELHDSATASEAAADLLTADDPPTALFSAQNLITIGVVERLRALDRHREVALVGFDDLTLADAVEPGLTVVAQDAHELGRLTAELLFARLDGDGGATRRVEVPTTLVARGSGELAA